MEFLAGNFDLVLFLFLLALGYSCGSLAERRHYSSIALRETEQLHFQAMTVEPLFAREQVADTFLVQGSAVMAWKCNCSVSRRAMDE